MPGGPLEKFVQCLLAVIHVGSGIPIRARAGTGDPLPDAGLHLSPVSDQRGLRVQAFRYGAVVRLVGQADPFTMLEEALSTIEKLIGESRITARTVRE